MRAMRLGAWILTDRSRHADRFVERWNKLSGLADRPYVTGDNVVRKSAGNEMAEMAKSLERDPQLESLLAAGQAELGITIDSGRSRGAELAYNHGTDLRGGRGLGHRSGVLTADPNQL